MPYKSVIEARKNAEKDIDNIMKAVKLGLEMKKEADKKDINWYI